MPTVKPTGTQPIPRKGTGQLPQAAAVELLGL